MNGRRGETNAAVNKAAGPGEPVTQEIAVTVTSESVQCAINGTVVASYPKADLVAAGKLASTDASTASASRTTPRRSSAASR
jgi:hypothetical protein